MVSVDMHTSLLPTGVDAYYNISPAGQITVDTTKQDINLVIQDLTARIEALKRV